MSDNPRLSRLVEVLRARATQPDQSVAEQREAFEAVVATVPLPDGVKVEHLSADGVPAEWVIPSNVEGDRTILYLHGGGYVIGSPATVRPLASRVALAARARVLTIDYRLAPEHPFPAAIEDSVTAYRWLLRSGLPSGRVVVAGDSAGGGLAVATLVALRDAAVELPVAGVCMSPWLDLTCSAVSIDANAERDPQAQRWQLEQMAQMYVSSEDPTVPLASPVFADLTGLPPLLLQVGTSEALLDDARALAKAATTANVRVTLDEWGGMIHVWHAFAPGLSEADAAIEAIGTWLEPQWER